MVEKVEHPFPFPIFSNLQTILNERSPPTLLVLDVVRIAICMVYPTRRIQVRWPIIGKKSIRSWGEKAIPQVIFHFLMPGLFLQLPALQVQ